jgi:L-ribulose-5-phosphate 4-epimerase
MARGRAGPLRALKEEVCRLNRELPRQGLVTWTSGNVSARDPKTGYVVIKPSGVKFEDLRPADQVVVDLDGNIIEGKRSPSVDAPSHLYVYRRRPDVNGVVHTHSRYATAFAAIGRPIPVYLTAIADEFGGAVPCAPYAKIGGEQIGEFILKYIGSSPAILMKNHGVFAVGPTGEAALKAAVMVEDVARTVHAALQLGDPDEIPEDEVQRAHRRYVDKYGQKGPVGGKVDNST